MSDVIKLTSDRGTLRISHPLPELCTALSFRHKFETDEGSVTFFDKKLGKNRTMKKRGKMTTKVEPLFAVGGDGALYTHDGMLSTVANTLTKLGFVYDYTRLDPQWPKPVLSPAVVRGLFPEQKECFIRMISSIGGCIIEGATSAGKTRIIRALIMAFPHCRIVVMTHRQSVVRGLQKNLNELLLEDGIKVGICQSPNIDIRRVTISTIGSAHHLDPSQVDILIGDEFHRFAADNASEIWLSFNRALKFGLSATLTNRFDGKDKYLESLAGPMVFELTDQELESAGRVPPLFVYFLSVPDGPEIDSYGDVKRKRLGLWRNATRNGLIKQAAEHVPADQQLLIFVETKEHLDELLLLMPDFEVCHGELNVKARELIENRFTSGEAKRVISTDCLSEGVDPRHLMVMIDATAVKGDSSMVQKRGRLRRPGKAHGVLIQFQDEWSTNFENKARSRIKEHRKRGDSVFERSSLTDIRFVSSEASSNAEVHENL